MQIKHRITITVGALLAIVALITGLYISQQFYSNKKLDTTKLHGTFLNEPRKVASFTLMGIDNKPFNNASLKGHWTLVFFGFTNCGSICPTTMAELGKMYHLLEAKGAKNMPQVVMISVDPHRDSLDKLNHYVKAFNPHFYGARGDEVAIQALTKEMGVAYAKVALSNTKDPDHYDIEHTGTVMMFNPKGDLDAFFTSPHDAALLAKEYLLVS